MTTDIQQARANFNVKIEKRLKNMFTNLSRAFELSGFTQAYVRDNGDLDESAVRGLIGKKVRGDGAPVNTEIRNLLKFCDVMGLTLSDLEKSPREFEAAWRAKQAQIQKEELER